MQPNTSFRLRMCISPLMFRPNIIPFSPWYTGSQNCKTGQTFFATFHGSDFSDTATHSATAVLRSTNTRQTRPAELPTSTIPLFPHERCTSHIAICDAFFGNAPRPWGMQPNTSPRDFLISLLPFKRKCETISRLSTLTQIHIFHYDHRRRHVSVDKCGDARIFSTSG